MKKPFEILFNPLSASVVFYMRAILALNGLSKLSFRMLFKLPFPMLMYMLLEINWKLPWEIEVLVKEFFQQNFWRKSF